MSRKRSQSQKITYYMTPFIKMYKKGKYAEKESRLVVA